MQNGGQVVWEFDVDNGKLIAGLDNAQSQVANAAKSINRLGENMTNSFANSVGALGKVVETGLTSSLTAAAGAMITLGTKGIRTGSFMQSTQLQMNGLTKSIELGSKAMMTASEYWQNNPFQRVDVASTTKTLLALGRNVDDLAGDLKLLGNVSVTTGVPLQSLGMIFGQISASGRIMGGEIMQLTQNGVAILPALGAMFNKTADEVREMASKGEISFDQFRTAMESLVDPTIIDQMMNTLPRQYDRLGGALTNLSLAFVGSTQTVEEGYIAAADGLLQAVITLTKNVADTLKLGELSKAATYAGNAFVPIVNKISDLFKVTGEGEGAMSKVGNFLITFFNTVASLGPALIPILVALALKFSGLFAQIPVVGEVIGGLGASLTNFGNSLSSLIGINAGSYIDALGQAFGAIPAIITTINGHIQSLAPTFNTVFGGIKQAWSDFKAGATDAQSAASAFTGVAGTIGGAMAKFTPPIVTVAQKFDALGNKIKGAGGSISGWIGKQTPALQAFGDKVSYMGSQASKAFNAVGISGEKLKSALGSGFSAVMTGAGNAISTMGNMASSAFQKIGGAAINGIGILLVSAATMGDQFLPAVQNAVNMISNGGIEQMFMGLITNITNALNMISSPETMLAITTGITSLITQITTTLTTQAPTLILTFADIIIQLIQSIASPTNITNIVTAVITLFTNIVTAIGNIAPVLLQAFFNVVITLINQLADPAVINNLITNVITFIEKIANILITNIPIVIAGIVKLITGLITAITRPDILQKLINATIDLVITIALALIDNLPLVVDAILKLTTGLIKALTSQETLKKLLDAGDQLIAALIEAIIKMVPDLISAGGDLIAGLVKGIGNAAGAVTQKMKEIASGAVDTVKNFLGIHSPSRVMAQIGGYIGAGLGQGILGSEKQISKSISSINNTIVKAFDSKQISQAATSGVLRVSQAAHSQLAALSNSRNQVIQNLKDANKQLAEITKDREKYTQELKKSLIGEVQLSSFKTYDGYINALEKQVGKVGELAKVIDKLKGMGLNSGTITELMQGGTKSLDLAKSIAQGGQGAVNNINKMQNQLVTIAGKSADGMYSAGVDAAKGLIEGLKSQQSAIENQMRGVANSLTSEIKKALGIRSPSRVAMGLMAYFGKGIVIGLDRQKSSVISAAGSVAQGVSGAFSSLDSSIDAINNNGVISGTGALVQAQPSNSRSITIGTINIASEVDGEAWLRRLTEDSEITSAGLTPTQRYM